MDKSKRAVPIMLVMLVLVIGSAVYAYQGVDMHRRVAVEEGKFHDLQASYWIVNKAERDGAITGSSLNKQLVEIVNYPSELLRLKLVGVGKILTGIYILLFGILVALLMMPKRLAQIIESQKQ